MPTHYQGTEDERRALDLFIKATRGLEALNARIFVDVNKAGLTPMQFGILETLHHLGPLTPSQIADKHLKSRNNVGVAVENLEKCGLIARAPCSKDRRRVYLHLTRAGEEKISLVFPVFVRRLVDAVGSLTCEEQEMLASLMKRLGMSEGVCAGDSAPQR